jgi:hypothetical protein
MATVTCPNFMTPTRAASSNTVLNALSNKAAFCLRNVQILTKRAAIFPVIFYTGLFQATDLEIPYPTQKRYLLSSAQRKL